MKIGYLDRTWFIKTFESEWFTHAGSHALNRFQMLCTCCEAIRCGQVVQHLNEFSWNSSVKVGTGDAGDGSHLVQQHSVQRHMECTWQLLHQIHPVRNVSNTFLDPIKYHMLVQVFNQIMAKTTLFGKSNAWFWSVNDGNKERKK